MLTIRRGAAWTTAAGFAPLPPIAAATSPDAPAFSLLAIQQEERAFATRAPKPVKTFAEIQEEERVAEKSRAEEVEFMRWWQEEEARISGTGGVRGGQRGGRGGVQGGAQRRFSNRGRGRGGGQSAQGEVVGRGGNAAGVVKHQAASGNTVRS